MVINFVPCTNKLFKFVRHLRHNRFCNPCGIPDKGSLFFTSSAVFTGGTPVIKLNNTVKVRKCILSAPHILQRMEFF